MALDQLFKSTDLGWGGNQVYSVANAGLKEQISNVMTMLSPTDTPGLSLLDGGSVDGLYHDWMYDRLSTAAHVPAVAGQEFSASALLQRNKSFNYVESFQLDYWIDRDTLELAKKGGIVGVQNEWNYQAGKKVQESRIDVEKRLWAVSTTTASASRDDSPSSATTGPSRVTSTIGRHSCPLVRMP